MSHEPTTTPARTGHTRALRDRLRADLQGADDQRVTVHLQSRVARLARALDLADPHTLETIELMAARLLPPGPEE